MIPEIFSTDPSWPYSKAKTAVIAAASAVIREEGPRAATLKNIATRAGITEPAIFRHFEGVDGLFEGLFGAYERVYRRSADVYSGEGKSKGMAKLREACVALVSSLAASHDFSYIVLNARHVFRGYPELRAKVAENDSKDQATALACISEGIKAGDVRTDIDPVSAASSILGGINILATTWIESGFGFDIREAFDDRWDDFERMVSAKPAIKSRESKAASRDRSAAYFPLRPVSAAKPRATAAKPKALAAKKAAALPDTRRKSTASVKGSKTMPKKAAAKDAQLKAVPAKGGSVKSGNPKAAKKPGSKAKAGPAKSGTK